MQMLAKHLYFTQKTITKSLQIFSSVHTCFAGVYNLAKSTNINGTPIIMDFNHDSFYKDGPDTANLIPATETYTRQEQSSMPPIACFCIIIFFI